MIRNALTVLLLVLVAGAGLLPFSGEPRASDVATPAIEADAPPTVPALAHGGTD